MEHTWTRYHVQEKRRKERKIEFTGIANKGKGEGNRNKTKVWVETQRTERRSQRRRRGIEKT